MRQQRRPSGTAASRFLWIGGPGFALAVDSVSVLLASGLLQGAEKAEGDLAPAITLTTTEGDFRISEQQGKVVVLYYSFAG